MASGGSPVALCAPPKVRDTWAMYFEDPGFARCGRCDYRGRNHPEDAWIRGWHVSQSSDQAQVEEMKRFIYSRLFRMKASVRSTAEARARALGLDLAGGSRFVGVHVRRGDKVSEVPLLPPERHAAEVAQLCDSLGTKTVFLASDEASTLASLRGALGPGFNVLEQARLPEEDYRLRGDVARRPSPPAAMAAAEMGLLVDVAILVSADAFVGTASSNVGRLVYFLRASGAPAISLDEGGDFMR